MSLREAIQKVLEHASPPPANEAATLFRIIDPLLLAMGYSPLEIEPEGSVSQFQRPDRTMLPGTEHEWYLEAKAWGRRLTTKSPSSKLLTMPTARAAGGLS